MDDVFVIILNGFLASEWLRFGRFFRLFFVNVGFVKISVSSRREHDFGPLERPKTHQKSIQNTHSNKTLKIIIPTSIFDCILAFQKPSQIIHFSLDFKIIKIHQKSFKRPQKWILGRVLDTSFFEGGFWKVLGRICEDF